MINVDILFQKIFDAVTKDPKVLLRAKEEWSKWSDLAHPSHDYYEDQSDAFLEWCSFERMHTQKNSLLEHLFFAKHITFSEAELPWIAALQNSYRSLFQIRSLQPKGLLLEDLWGKGSFLVGERRRIIGLHPGDVFEARIFPHPHQPESLLFSKTFLLHPSSVGPSILRSLEIAKERAESREAFLGKLQRLRLRCADYKHLSPKRIYESYAEPKLNKG